MEQFVTLESGRTRVIRTGEGPPLLWTHALFHPIDIEEKTPLGPMLEALRHHHVIRYDTRGQGGSDPGQDDEAHRWKRLGRDLCALAAALDVRSAVLGGASMGAVASIYAALEGAIEVTRLVLIIPPTSWKTRPKQADFYRALARMLELDWLPAVVRMLEQFMTANSAVPGFEDARPAVLKSIRSFDPLILGRILRAAAASDLPPPVVLERLEMPCLIVAVEGDVGHPVSTSELLARALPRAELEVWPRLSADMLSSRVQRFLLS